MIDFSVTDGLITALFTAIGSAVTFYVGRHSRTKTAVASLQATIDELAAKNEELYKEIIALRKEVADIKEDYDREKKNKISLQKELDEIKKSMNNGKKNR